MDDVTLVTNNRTLRRHLRRAIAAVGCEVFVTSTDRTTLDRELAANRAIYVVDGELPQDDLSWLFDALREKDSGKTIFLAPMAADNLQLLALFEQGVTHHIIARHLVPHSERSDGPAGMTTSPIEERELAVTCKKLTTGDFFGLDKHLCAWSVKIHEQHLSSSADKGTAILAVESFLEQLDCHRVIIPSISLVVDELLMNAFFNAPVTEDGRHLFRDVDRKNQISLPPDKFVDFTFACDGRFVGLSVTDHYGSLTPETVIHYLGQSIRKGEVASIEESRGAGLGLFMVFNSINRLIFNLKPGVRSEVIALFYIRDGGRAFRSSGQSLHIFS